MQLTLYKLPEGFIVTSNQKDTVGYLPIVLTKFNELEQTADGDDVYHHIKNGSKIVIAQQDQIDFSALKEEEQKKIGWFDVEELALNETSDIDNSQFDRGVIYGFHKGFKKSVELLSDRRFTGEDLANYLNFVEDNYYYHSDTWYDRDTDEPVKRATMFFKFKSQHKSWEIEVEMGKYRLNSDGEPIGFPDMSRPKLTNGKIKILKIR
jgi:hypothetical protein